MNRFTNYRYRTIRGVWLPVYQRVDRLPSRYVVGFQVAGRPELSFTTREFGEMILTEQVERIPSVGRHLTITAEAA